MIHFLVPMWTVPWASPLHYSNSSLYFLTPGSSVLLLQSTHYSLERDIQKATVNVRETKNKESSAQILEVWGLYSNWGNEFPLWSFPLFQTKAMTGKENLKRYKWAKKWDKNIWKPERKWKCGWMAGVETVGLLGSGSMNQTQATLVCLSGLGH